MNRARRALVATTLAAGVLVLPHAFGYWTAGGAGTGAAAADPAYRLAISPGTSGTSGTSVYPGGTSGVAARLTNPNEYVVRVDRLDLDTSQGTGGFGVDTAHSGCGLSALSFTPQDNGGNGWDVPARSGGTDGALEVTLAGALAMAGDAGNACQGATFTVYLTVTEVSP